MLHCANCQIGDLAGAAKPCEECTASTYVAMRLCQGCALAFSQCQFCRHALEEPVPDDLRAQAQRLCEQARHEQAEIEARYDELVAPFADIKTKCMALLQELNERDRSSRAQHCLLDDLGFPIQNSDKSPEDRAALEAELAEHQSLREEAAAPLAPFQALDQFALQWKQAESRRVEATMLAHVERLLQQLRQERELAAAIKRIAANYQKHVGQLEDPRNTLAAAIAVPSWAVPGESLLCGNCQENGFACNMGTCRECGDGTFSGAAQLCSLCSATFSECMVCRADLPLVRLPGLTTALSSPAVNAARQLHAEKATALEAGLAAAYQKFWAVAGIAQQTLNQTTAQLRSALQSANPEKSSEFRAKSAEMQTLRHQRPLTEEEQAAFDETVADYKASMKPFEDAYAESMAEAQRVYQESVSEVDQVYNSEQAELRSTLGGEAKAAVDAWLSLIAPYRAAIVIE